MTDASGANIHARIVPYEGGDIVLNEAERIVMKEADFPSLTRNRGKHLIVTDGTTLTRRYRIAPVENFEQVFADRMAANREQGCPDDDPRLTAPLFEITELA